MTPFMRLSSNRSWVRTNLITIITISSNVIAALAALYFNSLITQYSCNRTFGCNRTPLIGQLRQPIILSPLS